MVGNAPRVARLTKARRRALFAVGAFQSWKRYGAWGPRAQTRVRLALNSEFFAAQRGLPGVFVVDSIATNWYPTLTDLGRERFEREFGAPCPVHGWEVYVARHRKRADGTFPECCADCRRIILAVDGYEMKHDPSCPHCASTRASILV